MCVFSADIQFEYEKLDMRGYDEGDEATTAINTGTEGGRGREGVKLKSVQGFPGSLDWGCGY